MIDLAIGPGFILVTGVILIVGYVLRKLIADGRLSVPQSAAEWIEALTWENLKEAYHTAEQRATEDNLKRDAFVDFIQAVAREKFGKVIPDHLANFLVEYTVALMKLGGH